MAKEDAEELVALDERAKQFFHELNWAPCSLGRACSFLMMPFILGIMALTYVPYVHFLNNGSITGFMCMIIFHALLLLTLASYFQTVVSYGFG